MKIPRIHNKIHCIFQEGIKKRTLERLTLWSSLFLFKNRTSVMFYVINFILKIPSLILFSFFYCDGQDICSTVLLIYLFLIVGSFSCNYENSPSNYVCCQIWKWHLASCYRFRKFACLNWSWSCKMHFSLLTFIVAFLLINKSFLYRECTDLLDTYKQTNKKNSRSLENPTK